MEENLNELQGAWPDRPTLVYLRVSAEGQVQIAVAYLRASGRGLQRALSLVEQQNALQQFADANGYKVVGWYLGGDGVELNDTALSRLMADVVSEGRAVNAVLVWNYSRLSRNADELAEVSRTLREHDIDLVSVADGSHFAALERQLDELNDGLAEEAAS